MKFKFRSDFQAEEDQHLGLISEAPTIVNQSPNSLTCISKPDNQSPSSPRKINIKTNSNRPEDDGCHLTIPKVIANSSSAETLTGWKLLPYRI